MRFTYLKQFQNSILRYLARLYYCIKIKKNKNVRILVHLHLFYPEMWERIKEYLKNLTPYDYTLYVTHPLNFEAEVINKIKEFKPDTVIIPLENKGFDVGPYIEVISKTDLSRYDIIFKLHSKRKRKGRMFMYGNLFRKRDWFLYLFNGVAGPFNVHKTIDKLANDSKVGMVAAQNLIVTDPAHKQRFVQKYAEEFHLNYTKNYQFIAGTVFAVKASLMQEIKDLGFSQDDFDPTKRGQFSLAHALERLICIVVIEKGYKIAGNTACFFKKLFRRRKERKLLAYSTTALQNDNRFVIDDDWFYKSLETKKLLKYEVEEMPLKDIRRRWIDGSVYKLDEVSPYKYLTGDKEAYEKYCILHQLHPNLTTMSLERFDSLIASMDENGYDPKKMIVVDPHNMIMDGQHRACYLLHKFGEEYVVKVLKLWLK